MGNGMDKIVEGLYVGSIRDSKDQAQLKENNITHVLSIHDNATKVRSDMQYLCIAARDCASQDLSQYFSQTNDFIHKARLKGGNVLVHCLAGVSRSVTVTVVYLMTVTELGWRDALNAVRGARRAANPNFGFQRQLVAFEHDKLAEERMRLGATFPASPHDDTSRCRDLLEKHREWVLHGDSGARDEDRTTYPLPHRAYGERASLPGEGARDGGTASGSRSPRSPRYGGGQAVVKDQSTITLEDYLNVKAEKEAKQYLREQEEREFTSRLTAKGRASGAAPGGTVGQGAAPAEQEDTAAPTSSAAAAASVVDQDAAPVKEDQVSAQIDEMFNSS